MATPDINQILRNDPRHSRYGAPMGDSDWIAEDYDCDQRLHLQRVRLVDGDYGPDGTYWGASEVAGGIYCAFDPTAEQVRVYVRGAHTRRGTSRAAGEVPRADLPQAQPHRVDFDQCQ